MTKFDELLDYVDALERPLSDENFLEIGLKHKSLPHSEKNWDNLTSYIGERFSTGSSFRTFVKRKINKMTGSNNPSDDEDELSEERVIKIEKQKNRDILTSYNKDIRDEARIQVLKEEITRVIKELKPITLTNVKQAKGNNEAVLMLSDIHVGMETDNAYNKYNFEIATKRVEQLASKVVNYCKLNSVYKLNVCDLGDHIAGFIHPSIRILQQFDVAEQVVKAAELISQFLAEISKSGVKIIYRSVTDNHSRFNADKHQHIESENFNKIINWMLQERLKNVKNIEFNHDNIDDSIGKFTLDNGKKVMFAHGHLENINTVFQRWVGITKEFIDYILLGHFHSGKVKEFQGSTVYVNQCLCGVDNYALNSRLVGEPGQTLLVFNGDDVQNIRIGFNC